MRRIVLIATLWSLTGCSAVTVAVRGQASIPMLYGRPSFAESANGAQIIGRTEDVIAGKPVRAVGLAIRNATTDRLMEVDWREMSLVDADGVRHPVLPRTGDLAGPADWQEAVTVPPQQTARIEVATADEAVRLTPPDHPRQGAVVTAGTLQVPVRVSGERSIAELPITFATEADVPSGSRATLEFSYATRIPFEPGLAGLLGTMCFMTSGYFGGLCWLYLIFPTQGQKDRALQEAERSLREQYGASARITSSQATQVGW